MAGFAIKREMKVVSSPQVDKMTTCGHQTKPVNGSPKNPVSANDMSAGQRNMPKAWMPLRKSSPESGRKFSPES